MSSEFSLTLTVGQLAHAIASVRPLLPLRVCGFCAKDLPWGAATSERYREILHRECATAFDAATRRIVSQQQRLGYREGVCSWCRRVQTTLRFVNTAVPGWVCKECRGVPEGSMEG